jgi:hypothetical protein
MISLIEGCCSKVAAASIDQGNHGRNPWFSTLLQQPSIKEIMIETLGSDLAAASIDQGNHDRKVLNQRFLS